MNSAARYSCIVLFCVTSLAVGQANSPSTSAPPPPAQAVPMKVEMPSDPAALLALGAKKNGLQNVAGPWHLKAAYQTFDEKGAVKETGTFEEFFISDKKYKKIYSSPDFSQTDYSTTNGLFRTGNLDWPNEARTIVENSLFPQFYAEQDLAKRRLKSKVLQINGASLICITIEDQAGSFDPTLTAHCFNKDEPVERIDTVMGGIYHTTYNDPIFFKGSYLARSTGVSRLGKPFVSVRIVSLEPLSSVEESILRPTPNAQALTRRISLERNKVQLTVLSRAGVVQNPPRIRTTDDSETVILRVLVDTKGKVRVETLNGHPEFANPLADSIRELTYKPVEYEGEIVEVEYLTHAKVL